MTLNDSSTSKQVRRKENKKRKLSALLMISNINDNEKGSLKTDSSAANKTSMDPNETELKKRKLDNDQSDCVTGQPDIVKRQLSEDELKQLRHLIRERFQAKKNLPKIRLKKVGCLASIENPEEKRVPLFLCDVQHFILHSVHPLTDGHSPRWTNVEKFIRLKSVIILVVEGMSLNDFIKYEHLCPKLKEFTHKLEVITPLVYSGCLISELATLPLTAAQKRNIEMKFGSLAADGKKNKVFEVFRTMFPEHFMKTIISTPRKSDSNEGFSRLDLVLSPVELLEEHFPLPVGEELEKKYSNYVFTHDKYSELTSESPMWALDCEMCLTQDGNELTRISVVNEKLELIYESYVKPRKPIINYLTKFSGITAKHLKDVSVTIEDVQQNLRKLIPPDLILVGHSLNCDLHALQMFHPYCIDTSVIFNLSGERERKTKLKILSAGLLGEHIQEGSSGHNSIEDASACMKLVKEKLKHSIDWGDAALAGPLAVQQLIVDIRKAREKQRERIDTNAERQLSSLQGFGSSVQTKCVNETNIIKKKQVLATSIFGHLLTNDKSSLLVGKNAVINEFVKYLPEDPRKRTKMKVSTQPTNKAIVKYGRNNSSSFDTTIMYTVVDRKPKLTAIKVNQLVTKLSKDLSGNVLIGVLLGGRQLGLDNFDATNKGLFLVNLLTEPIPPIQLESDIKRQ